MSRNALIALLLLVPASARADDAYCALVEKTSYGIAMARLNGKPMSELMTIAKETAANKNEEALMVAMVKEAYALPNLTLPEFQENSARELANQFAMACYEAQE